ncbi:hypothetical protein KLP40_14400 [Hymenobacter sp. NST-14]|uniref:hypothetical protein n=1 Tax=Hymenobacter piscis TaxID=2839984 RepID=UPI001C035426|nr:hypothetical protein [Hymenobacter piscis]MBT9394358.1 hypothetical protein [Hymenobacter piscis]
MKRILPLLPLLTAALVSFSAQAQRPTQPAKNVVVGAATGTALLLNFTPGDGIGRTISMVRVGSPTAAPLALQPRDSVAYPISADYGAGPQAGGGWVVANTPLDIVVLAGLVNASWYQVQITEYNGSEAQPLFAPPVKSLRVVLNSSATTVLASPTLDVAAPLASVALNAWPNPVRPGESVQVIGPQTQQLTASWVSAAGQLLPAPAQARPNGVSVATPAQPGLYLLRLIDRQGQLVATTRIHVQQ